MRTLRSPVPDAPRGAPALRPRPLRTDRSGRGAKRPGLPIGGTGAELSLPDASRGAAYVPAVAVLWHSSPCAAGRRGVRDTALVLGLLLLLGLAPRAARTEDSAAFGILEHRIPGRILQVWPLAVTSCADAARDLLVLSTDGVPPNARKWLTWMPCGSALEPGSDAILERALPEDVVILDVAQHPDGRRIALIGQGFMPAEDLHVLRAGGPRDVEGVWFGLPDAAHPELATPSWAPFKLPEARRCKAP